MMAIVLQTLSAKLGIATGLNLAEQCRDHYPLWLVRLMWAGFLTAIATFFILGLERFGFRPLEAAITAMIAVVAGILGATVIPHAIYLHSALTQDRIVMTDPARRKILFRYEVIDVVVAMGGAGLINMAILIMAATTFNARGLTAIGTIQEAHRTLEPLLGKAAQWFFGISLLASGLSSSSVGTMAGQVIMQGFLRHKIAPLIRRIVTIIPSLIVIAIGLDPTRTLVISQVVLSFALPFAVIPLLQFARRRDIMGELVNGKLANLAAGFSALVILALNTFLIFRIFGGGQS